MTRNNREIETKQFSVTKMVIETKLDVSSNTLNSTELIYFIITEHIN